MGFSAKQVQALRRSLDHRHVRTRDANGRELSYIEGWYAISEANRIFGFDGWSRETVETRCVLARENRGSFLAVYIAEGADHRCTPTDATSFAKAMARAKAGLPRRARSMTSLSKRRKPMPPNARLATFGKPFGLELYRKDKSAVRQASPLATLAPAGQAQRFGLHPDDTTPIPRPSHYYGRRHQNSMTETSFQIKAKPRQKPRQRHHWRPRLPKTLSKLNRQEPTRHRRTQAAARQGPPEICGLTTLSCLRPPAIDPHHLRFAQPRAIGLKVSDEFTVPLCRGHHRELHQAGNERPGGRTNETSMRWGLQGIYGKRHMRKPENARKHCGKSNHVAVC